jgi:hypothetical protein
VSSELESLTEQLANLRLSYDRKAGPIVEAISRVSERILTLKRERGELFIVEYMRYLSPQQEEFETLDGAKSYANALEDAGNGYVMRIHGPGVDLGECEWND